MATKITSEVLLLFSKKLSLSVLLVALAGCAPTVKMIEGVQVVQNTSMCSPEIFDTARLAERKGKFEEVCILKEDSGWGGSIDHIIQLSKPLICKCGATDAYIQSSTEGSFWTNPAVTLVGIKFSHTGQPSLDSGISNRASQCKGKGGTLVGEVCQISLE